MALRWNPQDRGYSYEFRLGDRDFKGATGCADREAARQVEQDRREAALRRELDARPLCEDGAAPVAQAWAAVTEVVASAYALPAEALRSQSRGRGPRPPGETWEARKMAVHLTVLISGAPAAVVGGLAGLHKDTASSHCIWAREACADSDELERLSLTLEYVARLRLKLGAMRGKALRSAA